MKDTKFTYTAPEMVAVDMTADAGCSCTCGVLNGMGAGE